MFNVKKLVAGVALGAMVMGASVPAFATVLDNDATKDAVFYAQYNNGTWAAAPHDMDDANIKTAHLNNDGTVTLTLQDGVYSIGAGMSGYVEGIYVLEYDEDGNIVLNDRLSEDTNDDGKDDTVTLTPGADNKVAINMVVTMGTIGHANAQAVYLNLDNVTASDAE